MPNMTHCVTQFLELEDIENRIDSAIKSCSPRSWDENIITDQILRALTQSPLLKVSQAPPLHIKFAFDAFKQKGKLETNYWDIAFIVNVTLPNGNFTTGIAFLEAKRFYKNSNSYQMIGNWTQLNKMASNVSKIQVNEHFLPCYWYHGDLACRSWITRFQFFIPHGPTS